MQQNGHRSVGGPGIDYVEREIAAAELFHRPTISRREPLVTLVSDE